MRELRIGSRIILITDQSCDNLCTEIIDVVDLDKFEYIALFFEVLEHGDPNYSIKLSESEATELLKEFVESGALYEESARMLTKFYEVLKQ